MGYTTTETDLLLGLGCSAISDAKLAYAQNCKGVEEYIQIVSNDGLAVSKGHNQTDQDLQLKNCILEVSCHGRISSENLTLVNDNSIINTLQTFCQEGILESDRDGYHVTEFGRAFIRNICSVFDLRRHFHIKATNDLFSKAI